MADEADRFTADFDTLFNMHTFSVLADPDPFRIHLNSAENRDKIEPEDVEKQLYPTKNTKIPLDMYLLKIVFSDQNKDLKRSAMQVLISNFKQREDFLNEVVK